MAILWCVGFSSDSSNSLITKYKYPELSLTILFPTDHSTPATLLSIQIIELGAVTLSTQLLIHQHGTTQIIIFIQFISFYNNTNYSRPPGLLISFDPPKNYLHLHTTHFNFSYNCLQAPSGQIWACEDNIIFNSAFF